MYPTNSQRKAVDSLFSLYISGENSCTFKSPTGSGKTFMASLLISDILNHSYLTGEDTIIIIATISNAELPLQFSKKLEEYKKFNSFSDYEVEYISSPSAAKSKTDDIKEFEATKNKVYVFGTSSFGKNTLFYQNDTLRHFYDTCKAKRLNVVFIRDEAHIGKKESISKKDLETFDSITRSNSKFIMEMTATPKTRLNLVELTKEDMENDGVYLLKQTISKTEQIGEISNEQIIDEAIRKFKNSKIEYGTLDHRIRPAMLIQIMNEADEIRDPEKNKQFVETLSLLESKLAEAGLIYLKYLNNKSVHGAKLPNTLEYASEIDSLIDVIIFKIGPATGWDIPRANMILQLRNVSSETLNAQIIGRIMRNPYPGLEKNEITDKYYLFSNYQKPTRDTSFYQLKDEFNEKHLVSGLIDKDHSTVEANWNSYYEQVREFIFGKDFSKIVTDWQEKDIVYDYINYGGAVVPNKINNMVQLVIYNIKKFKEYKDNFRLEVFMDDLEDIANDTKVNIEIVKYYFVKNVSIISDIKNKTSDWFRGDEPYFLDEEAGLLKNYQLWVDNEFPKFVDTNEIRNYGYFQITGEKNIQFLDSKPEKEFFDRFNSVLSSEQKENISFFAKMPTLGSKIFFEYYSHLQGKICRSFIDFAIEYKDKIIMAEVKSKDNDYSEEKTLELTNAYNIYMEKFPEKKLKIILYQYDEKLNTPYVQMNIDGEWKENVSFRDAVDILFG